MIRLRAAARCAGLLLLPVVVSSALWAMPQQAIGQEATEATVTIRQLTPGNVFVEGETPRFDVATPASEVSWSVHDHRGEEVPDSGGAAAPGRVSVPVGSVGYYELEVRAQGGGSASTTFTVMPQVGPSAANPFLFGVQTHFGQATGAWDDWGRLVRMLDRIGVESVRDAQAWQALGAPGQGEPHWDAENGRFREYMAALDSADIEPLTNFGLHNRFHGGVTPDDDARRGAFAEFASDVVGHYVAREGADAGQRQIDQVGVYNEPNYWNFGDAGRDGSADALPAPHVALAARVYDAVHEAAPDATVAAPELAAGTLVQDTCQPPDRPDFEPCNPQFDGWRDWLDEYFRLGGLDHLDVVSLHPYRQQTGDGPEGLDQQLDAVRRLIRQHGDEDDLDKPIWITEQGWRTEEQTPCDDIRPVCEDVQAAFLPRTYVLAMAEGRTGAGGGDDVANPVERFYWFNFMDEANEDEPNTDADNRFGLVEELDGGAGYRPKPSYMTYGVMTSELGTRPYHERDQAPAGVHSHQFGDGEHQVHVMWVPDGETEVEIESTRAIEVVDDMGGTSTYRPDGDDRVRVPLSGHVSYVRGPIGPVHPSS